jgi:predicted kinase
MSNKPKCIIVTGRPGSGKTTLSRLLGERLWMPVISRDEVKEGYVNTFGVKHDRLPPGTNGVVSNFFFEIVDQYLMRMISVVIEAAFQHKVWEPRIPRIIETSNPFIVICSLDGEVAARRHLQRGLNDPNREFYHGDKRVSIYRETRILGPPADYVAPEFDVPTMHVSTEEAYSPTVDEIVNQIRAQDAQQSG